MCFASYSHRLYEYSTVVQFGVNVYNIETKRYKQMTVIVRKSDNRPPPLTVAIHVISM